MEICKGRLYGKLTCSICPVYNFSAMWFASFRNQPVLNFRAMAVRDINLRTCLSKNIYLSRDFQPIQKLNY